MFNTDNNVFLRIAKEKRLFQDHVLDVLTAEANKNNTPPEELAIQKGLITHREYLKILENFFFFASIRVIGLGPEPEALLRINKKVAMDYQALPLACKNGTLTVAFAAPDDQSALENFRNRLRCKIDIRVAPQNEILSQIENFYDQIEQDLASSDSVEHQPSTPVLEAAPNAPGQELMPDLRNLVSGEGSAIRVVDTMLGFAAQLGATDVHVEPSRDAVVVRLRIDGMLQKGVEFPSDFAPTLISRIKIISGLDIAERRVPQDGRYSFTTKAQQYIDCRVSTLPSRYGEKVVIRLLSKDVSLLELNNLQMPEAVLKRWKQIIQLPLGMILVTGPTGSGKTTTLYATIASLDRYTTNITTLEDPIEYEMPNVTQVQINTRAGMTFDAGLRSILRQDPDTILVGEIRDSETVEIACRSALTGHKIFSTLHTNDAPSAITRLLDMGIQPYLLTASLKAVLAQRLVRVLCPHCREAYTPSQTEIARLAAPDLEELYRPVGCAKCSGTGYAGRRAVFELMVIDDRMHRLIIERASAYSLREYAIKSGMQSLGNTMREMVISGATSLAEGERVVFADEAQEQLCPNCHHVVSLDFSVCPYCHHVLKETCPSCGNPIDSSWDVCPNCGQEIEREWIKPTCHNCLAPLEPEWTKCPYCGTKVVEK